MKHTYNTRGFGQLRGKTIKSINTSAINCVVFICTDGSKISIDCDDTWLGIGVIQARPTKKQMKK